MVPEGKLELRGPCYGYLDPASGRKQSRRGRARSALIVACHAPPAYIHVRYAWAERASTTELTDQLFQVYATYHPVQMAIETAGQQYLLYSHVMDEATRRGIRLPLTEGTQYTDDAKDARIREAIQPLIAQGRLCVMSHMRALTNELTDFPSGATMDLLDALAGCLSLMPRPQTIHHVNDTRGAILTYLDRARAPEHVKDRWR